MQKLIIQHVHFVECIFPKKTFLRALVYLFFCHFLQRFLVYATRKSYSCSTKRKKYKREGGKAMKMWGCGRDTRLHLSHPEWDITRWNFAYSYFAAEGRWEREGEDTSRQRISSLFGSYTPDVIQNFLFH